MRLFFGSFLDNEFIEKIPFEDIQKLFGEDLKPIKKENIHMTWVFLGDVEITHELSLQKIIEKHVGIFKGLIFQSKGFELWPPQKQSRLIVLNGFLNKKINLLNMIQDFKTICNPDEKDNFLPHITIARFKKDRTIRVDSKSALILPQIENFNWHIKEISLIQSVLKNDGPTYAKIKSWELI